MAKLSRPREEVEQVIAGRIQAGNDLAGRSKIAERTAGYEDWLAIFEQWREDTAAVLTTVYERRDIARDFTAVTSAADHSSARFTFPHAKRALETGIFWLDRLIERLELAVGKSSDAIAMDSLHPEILAKCPSLPESGETPSLF